MKRKNNKGGYSRQGAAYWSDILTGQARSGQTVKRYCQDRGISASSFYRWKKILKLDIEVGQGFSPIRIQSPAMFYTFFAACKHQNIDPEQWLLDVFLRIHDHKVSKLSELMPHNWKPSNNILH